MFKEIFRDMYTYSRYILYIAFLFLAVFICLALLNEVFVEGPKRRKYTSILVAYNKATEMSANRVHKIIDKYGEKDLYNEKYNYDGLYILYNKTKKKYFVGVDSHVLDAVSWQLSGNGYINLHSDVVAGDVFSVRIISKNELNQLGYDDPQTMWLTAVHAFRATNIKYGYHMS